ncbi:MAG TPA: 2-hydroxychromene-2-carboxylate isomerase [Casimicrobiaceae bacterium]|jgi:2-hydroxychromene-2-carboxylate isomerase
MSDVLDYYVSAASPFVHLGHAAFCELVQSRRVPVALKPIDLGRVFPVSGGLPLKQRAPQRQAYRLVELRRWSLHRGVPLNLHPKHFPVAGDLSACWLLAAAENDVSDGLRLLGAIGRALWAEDCNVADPATLRALAGGLGLDVERLAERAAAPDTRTHYDTLTQEAIDRGIFGVPTYVLNGEMFWGQDRLDFLARALAQ